MMIGVNSNNDSNYELNLLSNENNDNDENQHLLSKSPLPTTTQTTKTSPTATTATSRTIKSTIRKISDNNEKLHNRKCQGIVRNKRCDIASDNNSFSVTGNFINLTKIKPLFVFLVLVLLLVIYISSSQSWNIAEKIPVIHNSHVPGMKELDLNATSTDYNHDEINIIVKKYDNFNETIISNVTKNNRTKYVNDNVTTFDQLPTNLIDFKPTKNSSILVTNTTINLISSTTINYVNFNLNTTKLIPHPIPSGFLVWSDNCQMPNVDTYAQEVMKHFAREKYETCSKKEPLTTVQFNATSMKYVININKKIKASLGKPLKCCYKTIERSFKGKQADKKVSLTDCLSINNNAQLIANTSDNILVKCDHNGKQVYINGHPMMPERSEIRERLNSWKKNYTTRPVSILMIGIDSISRVNLLRAMPKTAQELYNNNWFELSGYNKMDDNTFPNLMAILTGFKSKTAYNICNPKKVHKLDDCPIIWKTFREHGYVTAYAEDETSISTFNYNKLGFEMPPVDYYLRPFLLSAEKNLPIKLKSGLKFCLGYQHSADYVFDYAFELATRYLKDPFFGLFWTNTFSHNDISDCSSMDVKVLEYIRKLSTSGILNESAVIFFSDHGMRFGPTRNTYSGHLEERLPFMFIWLPPWLKLKHPEFVNALEINKNYLTNPYDIHMTLKNLLELSGRIPNKLPNALDCPNCMTLLKPVPQNRSCQEIAIEDHWCTCIPYQSIDTKLPIIKKIGLFIVAYINELVSNYQNGAYANLCGKINLHDITDSFYSILVGNINYRLILTTSPGFGLFEATVRHTNNDKFEITGSISRLNTYASDSKCVPDGDVKKYCHCLKHPITTKIVKSTK